MITSNLPVSAPKAIEIRDFPDSDWFIQAVNTRTGNMVICHRITMERLPCTIKDWNNQDLTFNAQSLQSRKWKHYNPATGEVIGEAEWQTWLN